MAKLEERPVDSGIALAKEKDGVALVEWWKDRFAKIANIPSETARAGALLPQMRELSRVPADDRRRLVRARIEALMALPGDQRERIIAARKITYGVDEDLVKADDTFAAELAEQQPVGGAPVGR